MVIEGPATVCPSKNQLAVAPGDRFVTQIVTLSGAHNKMSEGIAALIFIFLLSEIVGAEGILFTATMIVSLNEKQPSAELAVTVYVPEVFAVIDFVI